MLLLTLTHIISTIIHSLTFFRPLNFDEGPHAARAAAHDGMRRSQGGRLLCLVHTASPSHVTRAWSVYDLWARRCDGVIFFSDSPIHWAVPHVYFPQFRTRDHSWQKIRYILRFAASETFDDYDWFLRADDDAFVLVENARRLLRRFDPTQNFLFGFRWGFFEFKGYADGSTYILSRRTLKDFAEATRPNRSDLCPEIHRAEEDQEVSRCLAKLGTVPTDSRDSDGRDRFHQFHPEEHEDYGRQFFISQHGYYRFRHYPDHISPTTIGMHHLSPYEMRFADFLVHRVNVSDF